MQVHTLTHKHILTNQNAQPTLAQGYAHTHTHTI